MLRSDYDYPVIIEPKARRPYRQVKKGGNNYCRFQYHLAQDLSDEPNMGLMLLVDKASDKNGEIKHYFGQLEMDEGEYSVVLRHYVRYGTAFMRLAA